MGWNRGKNDNDLIRYPGNDLSKRRRNNDTKTKSDFHHFVEDIYLSSKKYNIKPSDFIEFIKDLHDFYPSLEREFHSASNRQPALSSFTNTEDGSNNMIYFTRKSSKEYDSNIQRPMKGNTPVKQTNESGVSIEIPFISEVSYYINQIKLECKELEQHRSSLHYEIYDLENKKSTLENNLRETIDKNNNILSHLGWYDFLKQDLVSKIQHQSRRRNPTFFINIQ